MRSSLSRFSINGLALSALVFLAAACGHSYPYEPQFVAPERVSSRVLPMPPLEKSAEFKIAVEEVIASQKYLGKSTLEAITNEIPVEPEMMVYPVLGEQVTRESAPLLYDLLLKIGSDSWRISDEKKRHFSRPRPWQVDSRVTLHVPTITSGGYPSGHTTTAHVWAAVLSDVFPQKRRAFYQRADEIGRHRIEAGAHFPYDVKGGKTLAKAIYRQAQAHPLYRVAVAAAKDEAARR